jgi:hypothetical protein
LHSDPPDFLSVMGNGSGLSNIIEAASVMELPSFSQQLPPLESKARTFDTLQQLESMPVAGAVQVRRTVSMAEVRACPSQIVAMRIVHSFCPVAIIEYVAIIE